jgi:hypothetical protein
LHDDGWTVEKGGDQSLFARHPEVVDEVDARGRLGKLGWLTSGSLRIEFLHCKRQERP